MWAYRCNTDLLTLSLSTFKELAGRLFSMSMSMSLAIFSVAQIVKLLQSPRKRVLWEQKCHNKMWGKDLQKRNVLSCWRKIGNEGDDWMSSGCFVHIVLLFAVNAAVSVIASKYFKATLMNYAVFCPKMRRYSLGNVYWPTFYAWIKIFFSFLSFSRLYHFLYFSVFLFYKRCHSTYREWKCHREPLLEK